MSRQIYQWERYWYPRGVDPPVSPAGFLYNHIPLSKDESLLRFEEIAGVPCLILLGEPGIGKSYAMENEYLALKDTETVDDRYYYINLKKFSEYELVQELDDVFRDWSSNEYHLQLFLDSLDEARVRISTVTHILTRRLERFASVVTSRLSLRVACRVADWPADLEEGLQKFWNEETAVRAYVLAPLQRQDVEEAANANNIEPKAFLHEIIQKEVGVLASVPITLELLIRSYDSNQPLSGSRVELYYRGCLALCREREETHKQRDKLFAEQRLAVAARIAACTLLTNHYGVVLGDASRTEDSESRYLVVEDLAGGRESFNSETFPVWEDAVRETLYTGLFHGGDNRVWAHQTFAEFLAAWYVEDMSPRQVNELIFHPDGKLVPQLQETAAWIATMRSDIFEKILAVQPDILLRSDVAGRSVETKARLTEELLKRLEYEGWPLDAGVFRWFAKMKHPGMEAMVRPYVEDETKTLDARLAAIQIAEECHLSSLEGLLVEIAIDSHENIQVRKYAAAAVAEIGSNAAKAKLKPLALISLTEIVDRDTDQLKQYGLRAVWPELITAAELFNSLPTSPKDDNIYRGNYLASFVPQHLTAADLPTALAWVENQPRRFDLTYSIPDLMDAIMFRAWDFLDDIDVLVSFTKAALSRLTKLDPIIGERTSLRRRGSEQFHEMLLEDDEKRQKILATFLPYLPDLDHRIEYQILQAQLVADRDVPWLVQKYAEAPSTEIRTAVTKLIEHILWRYPHQFETIYNACQNDPSIEEAMGYPFNPVPLDSQLARRRRQDKEERKKWEAEMAERQNRVLDPPPRTRVLSYLEACESGKPDEWWHIAYWLLFLPNGSSEISELNMNLTAYPIWQELDHLTRNRIIETAKTYIMSYDPADHDWLQSNTVFRPIIAGYKAFRLLLAQAPDFLTSIPTSVWQKWASVLLFYLQESGQSQPDADSPDQILIQHTYSQAPEVILEALQQLIDLENEKGHFSIVRWTSVFWDARLAETLFEKAKDEKLQPRCIAVLLRQLLSHQVTEAEEYAKLLIALPIPADERDRKTSVLAASVLLLGADDAGWGAVWLALQADDAFGRKVIENIAGQHPFYFEQFVGEKLTEEQLADFYAWLVGQFPPTQDPELKGAVTTRHQIADFRNAIRDELCQRNTKEAILELQQLADKFPRLNLNWHIKRALERYHRETWVSPSPKDILKLARDKEKGLVASGEQLLEIVIESLQRLQRKLHGKRPAVSDLWNEVTWSQIRRLAETLPQEPDAQFTDDPDVVVNLWNDAAWPKIQRRKLYVPKDELSFSDFVARHLEELRARAVIVNREVEVRHGRERTDIHIDAFKRDVNGVTYDLITVVVEVKGCWNQAMEQAMKTQLVDRYLRDESTGASHGLYLVGLFNSSKWHSSDWRTGKCSKYDLYSLTTQLESQAQDLSKNGLYMKAIVLNLSLP